jgi:hypothetical protein
METEDIARRLSRQAGERVRAVAFWTAILLPFVYVPLLTLRLDTPTELFAFVTLVLAHAASLLVGYSHSTGTPEY